MSRSRSATTLAIVFFMICVGLSQARSRNDVLTQHNDNTRAGLNSHEIRLTPANVTATLLRRNGQVLAAGGSGSSGVLATAELYAP